MFAYLYDFRHYLKSGKFRQYLKCSIVFTWCPVQTTGEAGKIQITEATKNSLDRVGGYTCEPKGQVGTVGQE